MLSLQNMTTCFFLFLGATSLSAQTPITIRDVVVPVPPVSICQDGATHRGACTGLRLRPGGAFGNLTPFENQAVEISGRVATVTCRTLSVTSVQRLSRTLDSQTTTGATLDLDVFGTGLAGDVFLLFLSAGLADPVLAIPGVGPFHLDASLLFIGSITPLGSSQPMFSLSTNNDPILLGVPFYQQAVGVNVTSGQAETTNVDCFQF